MAVVLSARISVYGQRLFGTGSMEAQQNLTPGQALELAQQRMQDGDLAQAEAICRKILDAKPDDHGAYHLLGLMAYQLGQRQRAIDFILKAISIDGSQALYLRNIGEMYRQAGDLQNAVSFGRRAVALNASDAQSLYNLGVALADAGQTEEAKKIYQRTTEIDPGHGLAFNNWGSAVEAEGDKETAKSLYSKAVAINRRHPEAQNNLGAILSEQGDLDGAQAAFKAAIDANPSFVDPHFNISTLKKYRTGDPHTDMLESLAKRRFDLPDQSRSRLCFALGKAREDLGYYKRAFDAYAEGNRLARATIEFDEKKLDRTLESITGQFTKDFIASKSKYGHPDPTPVFIVGMPRSGTTLLEQVLSSHPSVYGAGELHFLNDVIVQACSLKPNGFPQALTTFGPDEYMEMGGAYINQLRGFSSMATRITDKMPANFFHIGMIHLMMPNAKIIHSRREPMDTCWSNFTRHFNSTMEFAYDLEELGRYHNRYQDLMDHWADVLPQDKILNVDYESVVDDLESQARRMIAFIDMDWDDACLSFHKNPRLVQTASIAQVRQPIYKSSLARWRAFEEQLKPLQKVLSQRHDHVRR